MAGMVADYLLRRLRTWGVEHVFAYPGGGINGILAAWERADDDPRFIQARHEELAAFEAVGYAKFSGEVGVCAATGGPGAIHLLNGLYDAKLDHVPVVAVVGQQASTSLGGAYQQEVDLSSLYKDVAEYVQFVSTPQQLPNALDRAMHRLRAADGRGAGPAGRRAGGGGLAADATSRWCPPAWAEAVTVPAVPDLEHAAEVLNSGERVASMVGQGVRRAVPEVAAVADALGAGVSKALLGKTCCPTTCRGNRRVRFAGHQTVLGADARLRHQCS